MNELWIARDGESAGAALRIFVAEPEWGPNGQCWIGLGVATIDYHGGSPLFPALLPRQKAKLVIELVRR